MPYLTIIIIIACVVFFTRAAEFENESSMIWGGLSVTISLVMLFLLHAGWLGIIISQVGLFIGITIVRILRKS